MTQPVETPPPSKKPRAPRQRGPKPGQPKSVEAAQHGTPELPARPVRLAITARPSRIPIGQDPDTSMLDSLLLHLISEHDALDALSMDDEAAAAEHERLHGQGADHPRTDQRFRPGAALAALRSRADREEGVRRLMVADVHARHHRPS